MRLGVPGPRDLLRLAEGGYEAIEQTIALVPRVIALIGQIEGVVAKVNVVMSEVEETQRQARTIVQRADRVLAGSEQADRADRRPGGAIGGGHRQHRAADLTDRRGARQHRAADLTDSRGARQHRTAH